MDWLQEVYRQIFELTAEPYTALNWNRDKASSQLVDELQREAKALGSNPAVVGNGIRDFSEAYIRTGTLPTSYLLNSPLPHLDGTPTAGGTSSEVWRVNYKGRTVAIKLIRECQEDDSIKTQMRREFTQQQFCSEVIIWNSVVHPNIVPFIGVPVDRHALRMVSEWMPNGTVRKYLIKHSGADRIQLGLVYLHSNSIIHGDMKGDNIFVNDAGVACIGDFGHSSIESALESPQQGFDRGTLPWMAPELFDYGHGPSLRRPRTRASDVYALGMTGIEIFTGRPPFYPSRPEVVVTMVKRGERPKRPDSLKSDSHERLWRLLQSCWDESAANRPTTRSILDSLRDIQIEMDRREERL